VFKILGLDHSPFGNLWRLQDMTNSTSTKFPVVFIHGVFGFGRTRPMWNRWAPYWPEKVLDELNENHLVVHVGPLTSNHDRACEAFYQLFGGRVDYGEQHSGQAGHERYGPTHHTPLHSNWNASNPVHLVGHSFGATTALELYQLLCVDFFGVGSDYRWVKSIVSIAGPLTGSTMTHMVGIEDDKMTRGSPIHLLYVAVVLWFKLYNKFPVFKPACDLHLDQWSSLSLREMLSVNGSVNNSRDLGVYDLVPSSCLSRNARLEHLDKLHLLTIVSSSKIAAPPVRHGAALSVVLILIARLGAFRKWRVFLAELRFLRVLMAFYLLLKLRRMDVVTLPALDLLKWLTRRHARKLPPLFDGCDVHEWGPNDGFVNTRSMLEPWSPLQKLTDSSRQKASTRLETGRWYSWRVQGNHFAGTHWDRNAEVLYRRLFTRIAQEYEQDSGVSIPKTLRGSLERQMPHQNAKATCIFNRNRSPESLRGE
jgi:pimeloyl-ACP methyl ester carboxylesterase